MLKPPPLARDGRVAVVAPASAPLDPDAYRAGLEALRARGLRVEAPETLQPLGYLAAPDEDRLEALNAALRRDDLDAILCVRGGYGCLRLLDGLDYDAARARPKLLVGYSDVTALQLALYAKTRLASLSGPMVAPDWSRMDPRSEASFWQAVSGQAPYAPTGVQGALEALRPGRAEGVLLGGNLSTLGALLGTPFLPDLAGAILFVEDIGEPPYRIDRLFEQLRLAGVLGRLAGLVLGGFTDAAPRPDRPSLALGEVLARAAEAVPGPVLAGLPYGHFRPKASIPIGVPARIEADGPVGRLVILESAVSEPVPA